MSIYLNKIGYIFIDGRSMIDLGQIESFIPIHMKSATPVRMEYQGNWVRLGSLFIDNIIISAVLEVLSAIIGVGVMSHGPIPWNSWVLLFALNIGYYTYMEGTRGQTIGKKMIKIKVVREDGKPIDMKQAFTRNILRIVDGLFFIYLIGALLIWRSEKKQRLGDIVAKTVVVKA
jgi:uncharacterized RDD family membrane protein YckC